MRNGSTVLGFVFLAFTGVANAASVPVFQSWVYNSAVLGQPQGGNWCSACPDISPGNHSIFDHFNLGSGSVIDSMDFAYTTWYGGSGDGGGQSFDINIWSGDGSTMLFSQHFSTSDYSYFNVSNNENLSFAHVAFNNLSLDAGDYLVSWAGYQLAIPGFNDPLGSMYQVHSDYDGRIPINYQSAAFRFSGPDGVPPVVPLPAAAWLFGSALLGFLGLSRRRLLAS